MFKSAKADLDARLSGIQQLKWIGFRVRALRARPGMTEVIYSVGSR